MNTIYFGTGKYIGVIKNENKIYAVSSNNHVYVSEDEGSNWKLLV